MTTPTSEEAPPTVPERKTNFQKMVVTEVETCCHFWAQMADQGNARKREKGVLKGEGEGGREGGGRDRYM